MSVLFSVPLQLGMLAVNRLRDWLGARAAG